jgi:hypothetical protein
MTVTATPYTCSVCGVAKRETNHWYTLCPSVDALCIYTWGAAEFLGALDSPQVEHACGQLCAHKLVDRLFFNKIQEASNELRKKSQEVVESGV